MAQSLGIHELRIELLGDHLCHKRAANERTADRLRTVHCKPLCQLDRERSHIAGPQEQLIEVEPPVTVMTRLESEVAFATGHEVDELRIWFHGIDEVFTF